MENIMNNIQSKILCNLKENELLSQRQLAKNIGVSLGIINREYNELFAEGFITEEGRLTKNAEKIMKNNQPKQAIILGIPVISTNVSGAEEIISEAEAGLVVDDSEEGLLEGLEKILKNPSLITEWKNTITTTKSNFSYETRVKKLDAVLGIESK